MNKDKNDFAFYNRDSFIERQKTETFDLVIIGGGINGAGVARDAAYRGLKVALVEASDFASGTSSRSSKLIHGGIRYLENLEFGLVFEALNERNTLFKMAPHMVHPLEFLLPIYKNSRVGMFKMGLGMWLYDILALFRAPKFHERYNPKKTLDKMPMLEPKDLKGSYLYSDAYMDDDRLVYETLRSAHNEGACSVSYVKVISANFENQKVKSINCEDKVTGNTYTIKGKHFVGALGPWTDIFSQDIFETWKSILRPTKGVHLTFRRERLPLERAVVMVDDVNNRIVFGIPRHEMTIIGTTDTDFKNNPSEVHTTKEDVEYLLKISEEYFPGAKLKKEDIVASYSGVRPLVQDGSSSEGKVSREHTIISDPRNVTFVAGGKYTTYRKMAEEIVDVCLKSLNKKELNLKSQSTKHPLNNKVTKESLAEARMKTKEWSQQYGFKESEISFLIDRHGFEAKDLLEYKAQGHARTIWEIEALHAIKNTMCCHLDDFYIRRVPLFLSEKNHGLDLIEEISQFFAKHFNWNEERRNSEIQRVRAHQRHEMSWNL